MPAVTYDLEAGVASFLVSGQDQAFATLREEFAAQIKKTQPICLCVFLN